MCTVSMIGDHYKEQWESRWPKINQIPAPVNHPFYVYVTKAEFEELRKEVLQMKELLKRAVKYDEENNQPHCETDEKVAILKKMAELVGVSLEDVLKENKVMHYKNGREAKNGDKVVLLSSYGPPVIGILYDATAGNDYCNGRLAVMHPYDPTPNLKECLHLDDVLEAVRALEDSPVKDD